MLINNKHKQSTTCARKASEGWTADPHPLVDADQHKTQTQTVRHNIKLKQSDI
jgi:hypothetical protein